MKEKWTIEIEVDVKEGEQYTWSHMIKDGKGRPHVEIYNEDDGIRSLFDDGIHWHSYGRCNKELDWKLIKREKTILK